MITLWIKDTTLEFEEWVKKDDTLEYYEFIKTCDTIRLTIHPQPLAEDFGLCGPRCNIGLHVSDVRIDKHFLNNGTFFRPNIISNERSKT